MGLTDYETIRIAHEIGWKQKFQSLHKVKILLLMNVINVIIFSVFLKESTHLWKVDTNIIIVIKEY